MWFQPLLLRLPLGRGFVWLCVPLIVLLMRIVLSPNGGVGTVYDFAIAVSPGVALVGERKQWWVIIPAALADTAITMYGGSRFGWWYGNIAYGAILLWGTRRTTRSVVGESLPL